MHAHILICNGKLLMSPWGCRPQALGALLEHEGWTVLETEAVAVAGYTTQICVCALKPREAQ